ncbi:MAG: hypothetical protein DCF25_05545 [Leptolyngbya foveolarum]|uniref:Uncharacterized protein n=1 Tax=Leptolyngbya foveolarum TaxID=47253 RepID=A0A2W4UPC3_9CYAN|nr:MAG: hypothetical protein DCF25_05545 [Leptolyngbya foveolarum]
MVWLKAIAEYVFSISINRPQPPVQSANTPDVGYICRISKLMASPCAGVIISDSSTAISLSNISPPVSKARKNPILPIAQYSDRIERG